MRSLTPTEIATRPIHELFPSSVGGRLAGRGAVDPESDRVYVALERINEGVVEVNIIAVGHDAGAGESTVVAHFSTPVRAPFELPEYRSEVLDLHYFSDDRSLAIMMAGGDIATVSIDNNDLSETVEAEVVGSVDGGIKAVAWSPDEEQLVLITGEDNLVCMTRTFDLIHEEPLRSDEFGEDKFVNVGWGSKSTQFHGSLGKGAARVTDPSSSTRPASLSHPTDDGLPSITFRGDAAFFAVSSLDSYPDTSLARRQIRIFSRPSGSEPKLSATSEELPGLEGPLAWRPSGNLISGLIRYGYEGGGSGQEGRWEVAMLERNGLRHGGFPLRESTETWGSGRVRGMEWNCDSEVLAIWIERVDHDIVQLWTMKNYHYYLKQEISIQHGDDRRFQGIFWHPEKTLTLYLIESTAVQRRTFVWDTPASHLAMPNDTASVAVVDGDQLLITPFRTQNVPPPMSSYQLKLRSTPVHVSFSPVSDSIAVLYRDGETAVWDLNTRLPSSSQSPKSGGGGKAAEPSLRWSGSLGVDAEIWIPHGIIFGDETIGCVFASRLGDSASRLVCNSLVDDGDGGLETHNVSSSVERLLWSGSSGWMFLDYQSGLQVLRPAESSIYIGDQLIEFSPRPLAMEIIGDLVVSLAQNGRLSAALPPTPLPQPIASGVTSFTYTSEFLIYTTASQTSHYVPLDTLRRILNEDEVQDWEKQWEVRANERGALAVTACQSSMSLVLQMPRGNLETVYPRPLVLSVVRRDVTAGAYRKAFLTCRKHRLDLNLVHDLDPQNFMSNLDRFVDQIPEVDYLNLFVSSLKDHTSSLDVCPDLRRSTATNISPNKLNSICDATRSVLEQRDLVKYTETVLSTYVCKHPPDYEGGLSVLLQLQKAHPEIVEDAIKYIIFLSNVNQLYDVALGMYDFQLVLMVAQYSQKDPQEYLPFLKELRALEDWERKFRVDDHLGRYDKALRHLHTAGEPKFKEAVDYVGRFELYDVAFELYQDKVANLAIIHEMYGDHLFDRREFDDAALSYMLAKKPEKAMKAYERAHAWRDLLALAVNQQSPAKTISEIVERSSDYLATHGRHVEASQIMIEYERDIDEAVRVLCAGNDFSEAFRIISLHKRTDLIESLIYPGLADAQESALEAIAEMEEQLDKEIARIHALREIREEDPDMFYMVDSEPALEGVDVATNATTIATAFTRYTAAPTTAASRSSRGTSRTDRSRNRASRKRAAGRKGSVDEYEYLILSIGRLVTRLDEKSGDILPLLRHLVLASSELKSLAADLQGHVSSFRLKFAGCIDDAWSDRRDILQEAQESGGVGYDEGKGFSAAKDAVRPVIGKWSGVGKLLA